LDPGIQVFNIFPHDNEIDAAAGVGRRHAGELAHRADVRVGFEELAERDVGALFAVADRRAEWALEHAACPLDAVDGVLRDAAGDALLEDAFASVADLPLDGRPGGINDLLGALDAFRPDAVARNQRHDGLPLGVLDELRHGFLDQRIIGAIVVSAGAYPAQA